MGDLTSRVTSCCTMGRVEKTNPIVFQLLGEKHSRRCAIYWSSVSMTSQRFSAMIADSFPGPMWGLESISALVVVHCSAPFAFESAVFHLQPLHPMGSRESAGPPTFPWSQNAAVQSVHIRPWPRSWALSANVVYLRVCEGGSFFASSAGRGSALVQGVEDRRAVKEKSVKRKRKQ